MNKGSASLNVGVFGFGEVAGMLSTQMVSCGVSVSVYDTNLGRKGGLAKLRSREGADRVCFLEMEEVAARSDVLLSTVPPGEALIAAQRAVPHLCRGTLYVDMASVGPQTKREIHGLIVGAGSRFVEGVILEAISVAHARARILVCGPDAEELALMLSSWGLNVEDFGREIGRASSLKMVRSIVTKGLETILLEALMTARRIDLDQDLWAALTEYFRAYRFETIAQAAIVSHFSASKRRHAEMVDVVDTIKSVGINPIVSDGVREFFRHSAGFVQAGGSSSQATEAEEALADLMRQLETAFEITKV
jgi:3-hydroxyisobutyrate dehydrogenase-like beta-hydroxyacid dehydrogenase